MLKKKGKFFKGKTIFVHVWRYKMIHKEIKYSLKVTSQQIHSVEEPQIQ